MKRKRKSKEDYISDDRVIETAWDLVVTMTWHGVKRGTILGGLYGLLLILSWGQFPPSELFWGELSLALSFGLPFGAIFGLIAGVVLGIMNGLLIDILLRLSFLKVREWNGYRPSLGSLCGIATLAGGMIVFDAMNISEAPSNFFAFVVAPALIAAVVFAHASQHAADRYIEATYSAE